MLCHKRHTILYLRLTLPRRYATWNNRRFRKMRSPVPKFYLQNRPASGHIFTDNARQTFYFALLIELYRCGNTVVESRLRLRSDIIPPRQIQNKGANADNKSSSHTFNLQGKHFHRLSFIPYQSLVMMDNHQKQNTSPWAIITQ